MVLYFLDRNSSLTLATGLVCGTGQSQRVALLRKMKTEKGTSQLIAWWSGWRSMKTLMGAFVFLKHMLVFLLFTNRLGSIFYQWKVFGTMDVECMAKPFKHSILTKDRNALSNEKGIVLFRAG
jgi:hypothetical protein